MSVTKIKTSLENIKRIVERSDVNNHMFVSLLNEVNELANHVNELDRRIQALENASLILLNLNIGID